MKIKTTVSVLCLGWMMLLFFGPLDVHAAPCDTEYAAYASAQSAFNAAESSLQSVQRAILQATNQPIPSEIAGEDDVDVLGKIKEGMAPATPSTVSGVSNVLDLYALRLQLEVAIAAYDSTKDARDAAKAALDACETTYHKCSGCGDLIASEGITGHRSLLCSANHTYYECNSSDVWTHTTYLNCPVGGESLLACVLNSHQHDVRCSGCQNQYNAMSSDEGYHRLRHCTYCYQSFRNCDRPRGTCSSGINQDLPHSD